jgi:hypothetical protein
MGLNYSSFGKFMNPMTYKDQWSATSNGTYWAGAKLLARLEHEKEIAKRTTKKVTGGKRKSGDVADVVNLMKRPRQTMPLARGIAQKSSKKRESSSGASTPSRTAPRWPTGSSRSSCATA